MILEGLNILYFPFRVVSRGNQAKQKLTAYMLACFVNQSRIASATMSCCDHGAVRSSFRETATLMSSFTRSAGNR